MDIAVQQGTIESFSADALIVNLFSGVTSPGGATGAVDAAMGGQISELIASGDFTGKSGETATLYSRGACGASRVILVGLGKRDSFDLEQVRRASAAAVKSARKTGANHVATIVHGAGIGGLSPEDAAEATVAGARLALYDFRPYKTGSGGDSSARSAVELLTLVEHDASRIDELESGAGKGASIAAGVVLARDLGNHPSNVATPTYLARAAEGIAKRHGMRVELWDRERIVGEGMEAFASVARGTHEEPQFIILEHCPAGTEGDAPYVLVGKGITFDTGGISLKPGLRMGAMKFDMCGAGAVLGAMEAVGRLQLPLRVFGLVAATDNMPGGRATKPGDIVTALNGTTIEILNTDAEGRMVLADALSYARRLEPAAVVDMATLTGAIVVALGKHAAGVFPNDDALADALEGASERSGERVWRFPMWDVYGEMIKSDTADIKNVSDTRPSPGGSIFAGKFLERFVDYPWAHVDIAGVAWNVKNVPYVTKGASGYGVRLAVDWLRGVAGQ